MERAGADDPRRDLGVENRESRWPPMRLLQPNREATGVGPHTSSSSTMRLANDSSGWSSSRRAPIGEKLTCTPAIRPRDPTMA